MPCAAPILRILWSENYVRELDDSLYCCPAQALRLPYFVQTTIVRRPAIWSGLRRTVVVPEHKQLVIVDPRFFRLALSVVTTSFFSHRSPLLVGHRRRAL